MSARLPARSRKSNRSDAKISRNAMVLRASKTGSSDDGDKLLHPADAQEFMYLRHSAYGRLYDYPIPPSLIEAAIDIRFGASVTWIAEDGHTKEGRRAISTVEPRKIAVRKIIPEPPMKPFDALLAEPIPERVDEALAMCLRERLRILRSAGSAPVRVGKMLSRTEIAAVAVDILKGCRVLGRPPGIHLHNLFEELLEVDRPKATAGRQFRARYEATWIMAKKPRIGTRALARLVGVNPSSVLAWRRNPEFQRKVSQIRQLLIAIPLKGVTIKS